jgi:5-methylcytosine-specific restriction enzyme subunit McrC
MERVKNHITVFEHQCLKVNVNGEFTPDHLKRLQQYYGEVGTPFFTLIHNGVKFCEYVGILHIKNLTIEVLPKADKCQAIKGNEWRKLLIDMLRCVGIFNVKSTSETDLMLRQHSILDLYIEIFIKEIEKLNHQGLIKNYRRVEGNQANLKGSLNFGKHLQHNYIHKERFYVNFTVYDKNNPFNQVIYKALKLISDININPHISSRISSIMLNFPEVSGITVDENWFDNLSYSRKSEQYRSAIEIARLLLLNFHPDINKGRYHVLALMFDMNLLWEKFVFESLKKFAPFGLKFRPQITKTFWRPQVGRDARIKPDIVVNTIEGNYIIDTKWKLIDNMRPADEDLRQMFAYNKYYSSAHTIIIYPGVRNEFFKGYFLPIASSQSHEGWCSILKIALPLFYSSIREWQKQICCHVLDNIRPNVN